MVRFEKNRRLQFPLKIEGRGTITFGARCTLQKRVNLGVAAGSLLSVGDKALLETNSTVLIGHEASLKVGHQFKLGSHARLYVQGKWQFGQGVRIETYCAIFARETNHAGCLNIGDGTHIGDYTIIDLVDDVIIGKEVAIGPNCTLYTHDHDYRNAKQAAWKGEIIKKPIHISDGAWIGANVTILPGVTIGERAVIASGAVLTKDALPNTLYGGVPAKPIKFIG